MTLTRIEYRTKRGYWQTPRGVLASFDFRENTSDWNTISSITTHDEYGLRSLHLSGLAIDVGAHIGGASITLALDNPDLHVIAIEAIDENADLLRQNAEANGVADRITVLHRAAAAPGIESADVFWRSTGSETAEHHAFIGNSDLVYADLSAPHETAEVACVSLSGVLKDEDAAFLKIDCEGCEWGFLTDPAISRVERIVGEWHPVQGKTQLDILRLLSATHDVTFSGPPEGPGGFEAGRR